MHFKQFKQKPFLILANNSLFTWQKIIESNSWFSVIIPDRDESEILSTWKEYFWKNFEPSRKGHR